MTMIRRVVVSILSLPVVLAAVPNAFAGTVAPIAPPLSKSVQVQTVPVCLRQFSVTGGTRCFCGVKPELI